VEVRALLLLCFSIRPGWTGVISPFVKERVTAHGHVAILIELDKARPRDVVTLFRSEVQGVCRIWSAWTVPLVVHADADGACLEKLSASKLVLAVDTVPHGFVVAGDSFELSRYTTAAVLGSGIDSGNPEIREIVTQEACFCLNDGRPCCPDGSSRQIGEFAATRPDSRRSTEDSVYRFAKPEGPSVIDGRNIHLVAVRVTDAGNSMVSIASVLDALDWLATQPSLPGAVILSLETSEVSCGPCEGTNIANRALMAYFKKFRSHGVIVFTPFLGFKVRGSPACLGGAASFPASLEPPPLKVGLIPLGRIGGRIQELSRVSQESAPPGLHAATERVEEVTKIALSSYWVSSIPSPSTSTISLFSFLEIPEIPGANLRGMGYTLANAPTITIVHVPQVGSCSLPELVN